MRKVLVIGDVHGKVGEYFDLLDDFVKSYRHFDHELYSLQLGDFGFKDTYRQRKRHFDRSERYDIEQHPFFGGNHDEYPIPDWAGSLNHFGEVPFVPNSFYVRGAYSIDRDSRTVGRDWWPEEELDWKQSREALEEYIKVEPKHVFSHDAPQSIPEKMFPEKVNHSTNTGKLLEQMFQEHQPETWTFGHWHINRTVNVGGTKFQCLGELETLEMEFLPHEISEHDG